MKKLLFIIICISLFSFNSMAQVKVYQNGTVKLKGDRTTDDANDEVSAIVYGKYGTNLANGRLAIGDYGQMAQHGGNVFIGEYGTNIDSDILQIHGKYGYYLTRDIGNIVAYYKYSEGNKFNFNCDVYANGIKLTSDERLKNNINKLTNSLAQLKKLEGVSYNLLFRENTNLKEGSPDTEKEKKSKQEYDEATAKHIEALAAKKRLGFIAQDVQKVFPELVEQDSAGNLSMDYIGIIPILVEAVKELEARIEVIENDCCSNTGNLKTGSIQNNETAAGSLGEPKLYQNAPNPFSVQTSIRFEIPATVQNAQLHICNMVGTLIKSISINQKGEGNVTINANEFSAGMYLYSLVTDGRIVDTKQMLLTE